MIIRTSQAKIDEYYQKTSLNQSSLKVIIGAGMQSYLEAQASLIAQEESDLYYEEKEHFLIGSAVDCYITMGEDCYLNNYHFSSCNKPGESVMSIVKHVYDTIRGTISGPIHWGELEDYRKVIYDSCNANNYYMNRRKPSEKDLENNKKLQAGEKIKGVTEVVTWLHDNRWQEVIKGKDYFRELIEANGKQVLSDNQNLIINTIINNFTTHPYTQWVFKDAKDIDIIYQLPVYFVIDGIFCKALIDMVRVHHGTKTITGLDIKTMGEFVSRFREAVRKRGYHIQASFYTAALYQAKELISKILGKDVRDYKIGNFAFVVESTKAPVCPMIFIPSPHLLNAGMNGYKINEMDYALGWKSGIDIFKRWTERSLQLEDMLSDSKGVVHITENFQYLNFA